MLASARGGRGNASRASAFHPKVKLRPRRECEIKTPAQEERVPEKKDPEIPLETLSEVELDAIVDHQCEEPLSLQEAPSDSVPTLAPPAPVPDLVMPSSRTETCTSECSKAKRNKRSVSRKKQEPAVSIDLPTLIKEAFLRDFIKITEAKEEDEEREKGKSSKAGREYSCHENTEGSKRCSTNARALNEEDPATYRRIDETHRKAVEQFGTDFDLIQRLIPGKSRRQINNKYSRDGHLEYENLLEDVLQDIAAAAEKEDEFAFTWDGNRNKVG
ncbi:hypothetical protein SELMODRAFT_421607 [Selaginella moellendorffii]|uniref:Transcription factor TFIIIB component B'' Myb domain-containing protein n=1 Tax=Selaginella moellendorffii TaxID=88036 RepID=D8SFT0_SELML|nr:hypothetical protein SELMODRAFT_421607 [Selaginella moellendorffii]